MIQCTDTFDAEAGPWFVVWAESRAEKAVAKRLGALGFGTWLPTVKERHRWSDRWKEVELPLFPGYIFARASSASWQQVLRTPGVLTVVKEGGKPALVAHSIVSYLRQAITRQGVTPEPVTEADYSPGDEVIVLEGALCGVRGIVRERRGARQLILWVAEIGRGVAITIGAALVKAAHGGESSDYAQSQF